MPFEPRLLVFPTEIFPKYQYTFAAIIEYQVQSLDSKVDNVTDKIVFVNVQDKVY